MVDGAGGFLTAFKAAMSVGRKGQPKGQEEGPTFNPSQVSSEAQAGHAAPPGVPTERRTNALGQQTCYDNDMNVVPCEGFDEINGGRIGLSLAERSAERESGQEESRPWGAPAAGGRGLGAWGK